MLLRKANDDLVPRLAVVIVEWMTNYNRLLSSLSPVVRLSPPLYNATTAYTRRRWAIIRAIRNYATAQKTICFTFTPAGTCPLYMNDHVICLFMHLSMDEDYFIMEQKPRLDRLEPVLGLKHINVDVA